MNDAVADDIDNSEIVSWLESRVENLLGEIQKQDFWKTVTDPNTSDSVVQSIMKEVYLDIVGYQPHVIEAAMASIAQMPRTMKPSMIRVMQYHQADEWDHGEMALRDYINMGGDEKYAREKHMSPQAYSVASVWWMITHLRDPFAYIGALYLFEGLTPIVTGLVKERLKQKGMDNEQLEYVEFHSTEDLKHTAIVKSMINDVVSGFPESVDSIKRGYEYFEAVYPIPLWHSAYERAIT